MSRVCQEGDVYKPVDNSVAPSCLSWPQCRRKAGKNRETSGPAHRERLESGEQSI